MAAAAAGGLRFGIASVAQYRSSSVSAGTLLILPDPIVRPEVTLQQDTLPASGGFDQLMRQSLRQLPWRLSSDVAAAVPGASRFGIASLTAQRTASQFAAALRVLPESVLWPEVTLPHDMAVKSASAVSQDTLRPTLWRIAGLYPGMCEARPGRRG